MSLPDPRELDWLDPPPETAVAHAETLLSRLGADGEDARWLARLPLPPRLARMLIDATDRDVAERAIGAAALLGSGSRSDDADLLTALDAAPDRNAERQRHQLRALLRAQLRTSLRSTKQGDGDENALLLSVLSGFPDRVAQRRAGKYVLLMNGVSAELAGEPPTYEFMVVLDAEVRSDRPMPLVRMTARVEPEWLLDLFPEHVSEAVSLVWNDAAERVDAVSSLRYGALVLEESRNGNVEPVAGAAMLADKALHAGIERFVDAEALQQLLARIRFAGAPEPDPAEVLSELSIGLRSFGELREAARDLLSLLEARTGVPLREVAPLSLRLPGGRATAVHYEHGKPPWIASRLQDFFGMGETPRIGPERTPVVVHLLAPNRRAVQTTTDLAGFWVRLYPQVRRELMRRYPRHAWPENPTLPAAIERER